MNKKPPITPSMVAAAKAVFVAMAFEATIRPIVETYQRKILKELGETVELKHTWTLPDSVFQKYNARCHQERDAASLKVDNPDFCPLLVAEELTREAERGLINAMEPLTGLTLDKLLCSPDGKGLEHLAEYIGLNLRLLAPYVGNADEILKGVRNGKPDQLRSRKEAGLPAGS